MNLQALLERLGLPAEAAEGGSASFNVDDKVVVQFDLTADELFLRLRSAVGHTQDTSASDLTLEMAVANYAGATTAGACLGLNPVNGEILLYAEVPCAAVEALDVAVTRFVDAAVYWQERLLSRGQGGPVDAASLAVHTWVRA